VSANPYDAYYDAQRARGEHYQDYVADAMLRYLHFPIVCYSSRRYQESVGEGPTGVEIKLDDYYARSRRLWIEIAEKARPRTGDYVPSGIYRADNTWLYIIGDYTTIFVFAKSILQGLHRSGQYPIRENSYKTSQAFYLSDEVARRLAAAILTPKGTEKIVSAVRDLQELARHLREIARRPHDPRQATLFDWNKGPSA